MTQLLALTPANGPWRKKLADAAIKWSANNGECPTGDPALHLYIGELYYKDQQYPLAEQHLIASGKRDAANVLAELLYDWYVSLPFYLRILPPFHHLCIPRMPAFSALLMNYAGQAEARTIQHPMPSRVSSRMSHLDPVVAQPWTITDNGPDS